MNAAQLLGYDVGDENDSQNKGIHVVKHMQHFTDKKDAA
jgi:hypothetical protein